MGEEPREPATARSPTGRASRFLELGRISSAHGLRGEVKLALHWAGSAAVEVGAALWLGDGEARCRREVEGARGTERLRIVKLRGVDDRDAAEALRGHAVSVERSGLPELADGEYYLADLPGMRVEGPSGPVGRVVEVRAHPTVDTAVIELERGDRVEQPLVAGLVEEVDRKSVV